MHATSLRLPDELGERLNILARETGRSKTFYILEAIQKHLDDLEDIYLAEKRISDIRAGRSKVLSSQDVEAMLSVDD